MTYEKICEENYEKIYRYILGMTGKKECAEDLTQEVFYIALKQRKGFLEHENPEGFLYKTARNLTYEYFRDLKRWCYPQTEEEWGCCHEDVFGQICRENEDTCDIDGFSENILQELSDKEREIYRLYYIENRTMREIAQVLGKSETSIRMKYVRLRKKIKKKVKLLEIGEF